MHWKEEEKTETVVENGINVVNTGVDLLIWIVPTVGSSCKPIWIQAWYLKQGEMLLRGTDLAAVFAHACFALFWPNEEVHLWCRIKLNSSFFNRTNDAVLLIMYHYSFQTINMTFNKYSLEDM